ncbi:MAG: hypothetical protein PUC38_01640 [Bacteroidales bacterium]|nr:hypothetical protein [Bacteroidales bacterium]
MKNLILLFAAALASLTATAQTASLKNAEALFQKTKNCTQTNYKSEQGRDRLDSTYYLRLKTYAMPYDKKKDKAACDAVVAELLDTYQRESPSASAGFCQSRPLNVAAHDQQQVSIYYAENKDPFIAGTEGHNYALLRYADQNNPTYRRVHGVEWWYDKVNRQANFRVFHIFGPGTKQAYAKSILNGNSFEKEATGLLENLLYQIEILGNFYKNEDNEIDRATVQLINERIDAYLRSQKKPDELNALLMKLEKIPGYYTEVLEGKDERKGYSPAVAAQMISEELQGKIFCITTERRGSEDCRRYGDKSKNFLIQIILDK